MSPHLDRYRQGCKVCRAIFIPGLVAGVNPKAYHRFDRGPASGTASGRTREGNTYRLDEKAKQDVWTRTLAWFRKYLPTVP